MVADAEERRQESEASRQQNTRAGHPDAFRMQRRKLALLFPDFCFLTSTGAPILAPMHELSTDILIVGGGVGGCAAAMSAASLGYRVVLTEPTDWLGGQLTSQAVPSDEHPWIESHGCTRRYRAYRDGVRQYYRDHYPLTPEARANRHLNPGNGGVSRICHEPRVGLAVIESMLAYERTRGRVRVLLEHAPVAADVQGDTVKSVTLRNLRNGDTITIAAPYVLDASELGDLLPLTGTEYMTGAESRSQTNEPHAPDGSPQPQNMQAITWCFPMAFDPSPDVGDRYLIEKPAQYEFWRDYVPALKPAWPGKFFAMADSHPITVKPRVIALLPHDAEAMGLPAHWTWWRYRKIVCHDHYMPGSMPHEVTLVNWPRNDYFLGSIIDQPADVVAKRMEGARQLSLSLLYWLQTEHPRPDGKQGYPGLHLRPEITGTADGLAKFPYIRESRRIKAAFTVTENHVGVEARGGWDERAGRPAPAKYDPNPRAEKFPDSVGVGCYRIDLHMSTGGDNYIDISSLPFQIPLGSLLPVRMKNLIPACKNIGTTHITNGCYRLHPVEWNIGEAAGALAAFCLQKGTRPHAVREDAALLEEFQTLITAQGFELDWLATRPV